MGDTLQSALINFVGWPLAITMGAIALIALAIAAVIVARMFRPQIADLVSRRLGGVNEGAASEKNVPQKGQTSSFPEKVLEAADIGKIPAMTEQETAIRRDIEAKSYASSEDKVEVLIRHLAVAQISLRFEGILRDMFLSQLTLLKLLSSAQIGREQAEEYYKKVQEDHSELANYSLESYMEFLLSQGLVIFRNNIYSITNTGRGLLAWIPLVGYDEFRLRRL